MCFNECFEKATYFVVYITIDVSTKSSTCLVVRICGKWPTAKKYKETPHCWNNVLVMIIIAKQKRNKRYFKLGFLRCNNRYILITICARGVVNKIWKTQDFKVSNKVGFLFYFYILFFYFTNPGIYIWRQGERTASLVIAKGVLTRVPRCHQG